MNLEELYAKINGDYAEIIMRFGKETRVKKFLQMFLRDPSVSELQAAVAAADWETAFRAVHTLKGVAGNMSFTGLQKSASELTEAIRCGKPLEDAALYEAVCKEYEAVTEGVRAFLEANP